MKTSAIILAKLAITGLLFWYLTTKIDFSESFDQIFSISPGIVILVIALIMAEIAVVSLRWKIIMKKIGINLRVFELFKIYLVANFFNVTLLSSLTGDAFRVWKLSKITNYITEKKECRSKLLLHYFGEEDSAQCGKCDFCIRQKREQIKEVEYQKISTQLEKILNDKELTLEEICTLLPKIHEGELINVIQFLFDNDKIGKFGNKYQWRSI